MKPVKDFPLPSSDRKLGACMFQTGHAATEVGTEKGQ